MTFPTIQPRALVLAGLLAAGGLAVAQPEVIGTATEVEGLVTISDGQTLSSAHAGEQFRDGSTVITGSGSSATLRLTSGCVLRMKANQQIQVNSDRTCDELLALLNESSREAAVFALGGREMGAIAAALLGAALIRNARVSQQ